MGFSADTLIWSDRKRYFGLPLSFTKYAISEDRLLQSSGILNLQYEEILLYRVRDISLSRSFGQRIFGVGTICVVSSDKSVPHLDLISEKDPRNVKELIHRKVEAAKDQRRMRTMEIMGSEDADHLSDDQLDMMEDPFHE